MRRVMVLTFSKGLRESVISSKVVPMCKQVYLPHGAKVAVLLYGNVELATRIVLLVEAIHRPQHTWCT